MILMQLMQTRRFQLLMVFLALPAQYWLSILLSPHGSNENVVNIIGSVSSWTSQLLSVKFLCDLPKQLWLMVSVPWASSESYKDNFNEQVVPSKDTGNQNFGFSSEIRAPRPGNVLFRVGDVIQHTKYKYRGVIVAWDPVGRAPAEWFKAMYPNQFRNNWKNQPTYRILVDTRDRPIPQFVYVPQDNIAISSKKPIMHPFLDEFFELFDGERYKLRPRYSKIYPFD